MANTTFNIKYSMIFSVDTGYGWQEVHYGVVNTSGFPDLPTLINSFETAVATPRIGLLANDCILEGIRVSYKNPGNGIASKAINPAVVGACNQASLDQNTSLSILMQDVANLRHKIIHLRGFPSPLVYGALYQPARYPGWSTLLGNYVAGLTNGNYGWLNSASSSRGNVSNYVVQANGTIIFTVVADNPGTALPVGTAYVPVRFSKLNESKSVLNKTIVCQITSATTIQTVAPVAAGLFSGAGRFTCNFQPTFTAYGSIGPIKVGERRMGKPIGRYPGRRARRPVT